MSEKNPQPKDRSNIASALIGAGAVVITAVITSIVAPVVLRTLESSPTPLVITATPPPTAVSQATTIPPTGTPQPSATIQPTLVLSPTIELRAASATPVPPSPTPNNIVTLILVNNLPNAMEFFVDGKSVTEINSRAYQALQILRGERELKQCVLGSDDCFSKIARLEEPIDYWEMYNDNNPLRAQGDVILVLLNQQATPRDVFVDGTFAKTVPALSLLAINLPQGSHTLQACFEKALPSTGPCRAPEERNLNKPIDVFRIPSGS